MHKDHVASCFCCKHFYMTMGDEGYSEYTPGLPPEVSCRKGRFDFGRGDYFDLHETFSIGETCRKFNGRD